MMNIDESKVLRVKAIDILPYKYELVHTLVGAPGVFSNPICGRRWSEKGDEIIFMLDSCQTFWAAPDKEVAVIEATYDYGETFMASAMKEDASHMEEGLRETEYLRWMAL